MTESKGMSLEEQLFYIETHFPDAWEYLHDIAKVKLPKFDDNDELIEEDGQDESN